MAAVMVRTERLKLLANFVCVLGLGLIAIAVLRPLLETGGDLRQIALWAFAELALHGIAHLILGHTKQGATVTLYDILVSTFALAFGVLGVLIVHFTDPERKQPKHR
jgi:hypothetical protein